MMGNRMASEFAEHDEIASDSSGYSVALLIQGPLHPKTIDQVKGNAHLFSNIVISTWEPSNEHELEIWNTLKELENVYNHLRLIARKLPEISNSALPERFHLQVLTIHAALDLISEKKIIKTRSDEFMNLRKFKDFVKKSRYTFQCGNFIVRDWNYHSFHISDHLFAAPRLNLEKGVTWLLSASQEEFTKLLGVDSRVPESLLGLALLKSDVEHFDNSQTSRSVFQMFKSRFELFDLENLDSFEVLAKSAGTGYLTSISHMPIEIRNLINWNYFTDMKQLKPSILNSFVRRKIQPWIRQILINNFKRTRGVN